MFSARNEIDNSYTQEAVFESNYLTFITAPQFAIYTESLKYCSSLLKIGNHQATTHKRIVLVVGFCCWGGWFRGGREFKPIFSVTIFLHILNPPIEGENPIR